jgi:hypothetical protein
MKTKAPSFACLLLLLLITGCSKNSSMGDPALNALLTAQTTIIQGVWPVEKANAWYAVQKKLAGSVYIPATAINQLEMWQADTFDPATIDKELGWGESLGFNTMRVFLHSIAWKQDPDGFKRRVEEFLTISARHKIEIIFVFFDDCWNWFPMAGKQPDPLPGIHNSGWVQDPGQFASGDTSYFHELEKYVTDVMTGFAHDKRILLWDLYNEPGSNAKNDLSMALLQKTFRWARAVNPDQPISAGLWQLSMEKLTAFQIQNSDIITYHNYQEPDDHLRVIQLLKMAGRPLICTEYMARTKNSRFSNILPLLKKENIGAINWGLVAGKTNTIYAWGVPITNGAQLIEWFHDIFFKDGTPYRKDEVELIKEMNK